MTCVYFKLYFIFQVCAISPSSTVNLAGENQSIQEHTETAPTDVSWADDLDSGKYSEFDLNDLTFGP